MTSTPGWDARMATSVTLAAERRPRYVERFTLTERLLHWVHASAFFVLLGGPSARPEAADECAVDEERNAAGIDDDARIRDVEAPVVAAGLRRVHEVAGARPPEDGRARLPDGELHRSERGAVHALGCDHVAARVRDARGDLEGARFRLGPDVSDQLECTLE